MSIPSKPKHRQRIGYQAMLLGGFATLATTILMMSNLATQEDISLRQKEDLLLSLSQVIPHDRYDNDLLLNTLQIRNVSQQPITIYRGIRKNQVTAIAYEISRPGYSGEITLLLGIDTNGRILGVRVLSHTETPGLGDKIEIGRSNWIEKFTGLSLANPIEKLWKVKKDGGQFDSFSGATITPRAVVAAIHDGLIFYALHKQEIDTLTLQTESEVKE